MLLAKCCHDLDWLSFLVGRRCAAVSSFGGARPLPRPSSARAAPASAAWTARSSRSCAYSAARLYLEMADAARRAGRSTCSPGRRRPRTSSAALREGPYGRCVWACDNDVVDHQVVALRYEGGATASLTMTAFTRMRERETRIFGTRGELTGDGSGDRGLRLPDERDRATRRRRSARQRDRPGHGGGDDGVMAAFVAAVAAGDGALVPTSPAETLASHRIAFAAESAREQRSSSSTRSGARRLTPPRHDGARP